MKTQTMLPPLNISPIRLIESFFIVAGVLVVSFPGCSKAPKNDAQKLVIERLIDTTQQTDFNDQQPDYEISSDKSKLASYYELPDIKEWYKQRVLPPQFNFKVDLSNKNYMELRLLRNEIYARNGYLFKDAALRGYFNKFKWYQPIFDVPSFRMQLDQQEKEFIDTLVYFENQKFKQRYANVNGNKLADIDYVVNLIQFETINDSLSYALKKMNFALAPANNEQLFYVYDKNQYGYIPNFITTDLYLQILHKYLGGLMQRTEEDKLVGTLNRLMRNLYNESRETYTQNTKLKTAIDWADAYLAIGMTALNGVEIPVRGSTRRFYEEETKRIENANGMGSDFLNRELFDYSQFKPRGNYTKNDTLKGYFRCMKWLNSAPINIADDDRFLASILIAYWINKYDECRKDYRALNGILGILAGEEDNCSINNLLTILNENHITKIEELTVPQTIDKIRSELLSINMDRIQPIAGNDKARREFSQKFILFTASRYTFDAEVLAHLVHVSQPTPLRPFPKGLDVFAALGNRTAEDVLLNENKETDRWPAFRDSLSILKIRFGNYSKWNASIYNKTMDCINSLNSDSNNIYPLFMQTRYWEKKNLNTSLAAWAELKHDMILYTEQPYAAEAGEGGGPPPPVHLSYVEPNIRFWGKAIELLEQQEKVFSELGLLNRHFEKISADLKELAIFLLNMSNKEIRKEQITEKEFSEMTWIGGKVEQLTLDVLESDHLPERERQIALIADVYSYNQSVLEEAVGMADEIYVVAEINGLPHLTKGSCFSYYEFENSSRLSDEEWQQLIATSRTPARPTWLNEIYVNTKSVHSKPGHSFSDYVSHN